MNYQNKTKEELLIELQELRQAHHSLKALYDKDITDNKQAKQRLIPANKELAFQKEEKENNASTYDLVQHINELSVADKKIIEHERQFLKIFDSNPIGMTLSEVKSNKIKYVNNQFCTAFGYSRDEVIGHTSDELNLLSPEESERLLSLILGYLKENRTLAELQSLSAKETEKLLIKLKQANALKSFEVRYTRKNGETFFALVSYEIIEIGNARYTITSYQDITERKKVEDLLKITMQNLERSNNELEQFAYVASHDLQEPLRMVSSFTQLLERRYKDKLDQDANDFIQYAVDGANRMQKLINDLLDYSRITSRGKDFSKVDISQVLGQTISTLQQLIIENTALITNEDLPELKADESQIIRVFQNLIENAIKFKKKSELPKIHISCKKKEGFYEFTVRDNGIGMNMQFHDRVFTIFQRLHTKEEYPGTGIGLSICKHIVERHGGKIWFESKENEGTTFYFTLKE